MKTELPARSLIVKDRLSQIVEEILVLSEKKIAKIILFGSYARGTWVEDTYVEGHITYSYQSDLDILLVMKKGGSQALRIEDRIEKQLEKKELEDNPWVTLIIESTGVVNKQLEKGHYFFSDIKKEGILLYDSGEYELLEAKELSNKERKEIGEHDGSILYTIGERHGFTIHKKSPNDPIFYVVGKDLNKNTITVSEMKPKDASDSKNFALSNVSYTSEKYEGEVEARVRYRQALQKAILENDEIKFEKNQEAIAKGQSVVFYKSNQCLGGGIIR